MALKQPKTIQNPRQSGTLAPWQPSNTAHNRMQSLFRCWFTLFDPWLQCKLAGIDGYLSILALRFLWARDWQADFALEDCFLLVLLSPEDSQHISFPNSNQTRRVYQYSYMERSWWPAVYRKRWPSCEDLEISFSYNGISLSQDVLTSHSSNIFCVAPKPDDPGIIVTGGADGTVRTSYLQTSQRGTTLHLSPDLM